MQYLRKARTRVRAVQEQGFVPWCGNASCPCVKCRGSLFERIKSHVLKGIRLNIAERVHRRRGVFCRTARVSYGFFIPDVVAKIIAAESPDNEAGNERQTNGKACA